MIEVVVNRCFGGFGLSPKAQLLMLEKQGKQGFVYEEDRDSGWDNRKYNRVDEVPKSGMKYHIVDKDLGATTTDKDEFWKHRFSEYDVERDDPILVEVVKELGSEANGWAAQLEVVEIPDGTNWQLDEYDGRESVEEVHQRW